MCTYAIANVAWHVGEWGFHWRRYLAFMLHVGIIFTELIDLSARLGMILCMLVSAGSMIALYLIS